ncbi:MAG: biopolymer transporter ExbD [Chitinophagales bacterium]|nr:biopolymer transporter ExbD [Chitinophagales bacterium]
MAAIVTSNTPVSAKSRPGVHRVKKHSLRTDMTPMVDLGFLLITFFIFTAELSKPVVTKLVMPTEGGRTTLGESDALTVLLGKNDAVYYYHGNPVKAFAEGKIYKTSFAVDKGIGNIIRDKQKQLANNPASSEGKDGLMLLIKPGEHASYQNVIDMLDEAMINNVKKYALLKQEKEEVDYVNRRD